jgi:archaellum biogenesis protein FlaJ (TadC family)
MYIILIFTTSAFGAPLLFGTSTFIVEVMNAQMAGIGAADIELVSQMPSNLGFMQSIMGFGQGSQISTEFIIFFSMLCLVIVAIFSSLTIGIINTGSEKNGIRFMPVMLVVCFALFFVTREVLHLFFGGMIA